MFLKFLRKLVNKQIAKERVFSKRFAYSISFEKTKINWYSSGAMNAYAATGGTDMAFFTEPPEDKDKWGAMLTTYIVDAGEEIYSELELNLTKLFGALQSDMEKKVVEEDEFLRPRLIKIMEATHGRDDSKWTLDEKSLKRLPSKSFYGLVMIGKIKSETKQNYTTFDVVAPIGKQLLVVGALMPENPDPTVLNDVISIGESLVVKLQK